MTDVTSCPKFKEEWEIAAREKNCSKIATEQNCVVAEKFKYHCVINGHRNALLEVCAPERLILGIFFGSFIIKFVYCLLLVNKDECSILYFYHILNNYIKT